MDTTPCSVLSSPLYAWTRAYFGDVYFDIRSAFLRGASMARRDRYTIGHVYQPTTPRQPYGRRAFSRPLVEELPHWVSIRFPVEVPAADVPMVAGGAHRVAVPMPHGGVRWLLECPRCQRHVSRLYYRADLWDSAPFNHCGWRPGLCRTCWGFRYASQYTGRRPEAAKERVEALRRAAVATHDPKTRRRRLERVRKLNALRIVRIMRYNGRKTEAFILGAVPALIRFDARIQRSWLRATTVMRRESVGQRAQLALDIALNAERWAAAGDTHCAEFANWAASTRLASLGGDAETIAAIPPGEQPADDILSPDQLE
jgi:hypothetical protein